MAGAAAGAAGVNAMAEGAMHLAGSLWSAKEAKRARQWSKKMYQRRYQYTMADMREAGLNPILAGNLGAGAVPSAAVGQPGQASSATPGTAFLEGLRSQAQTENITRDTALINERLNTQEQITAREREETQAARARAAEHSARATSIRYGHNREKAFSDVWGYGGSPMATAQTAAGAAKALLTRRIGRALGGKMKGLPQLMKSADPRTAPWRGW